MKIFIKMMCIFTLSGVVLVSCSKDGDLITSESQDSTTNTHYESLSPNITDFDYSIAVNNVAQAIENQSTSPSFPLSQAEIDNYLTIAGVNETMDASQLNYIAAEILTAQRIGMEVYLEQNMSLEEFTKTNILAIANSGPIDFTGNRQFDLLPEADQMVLNTANTIASDFQQANGILPPDDVVIYGSIGAGIGVAVGFAFGCPPCAAGLGVVGGIIGGVVGLITGNKQ